jgi:hypothetical protein
MHARAMHIAPVYVAAVSAQVRLLNGRRLRRLLDSWCHAPAVSVLNRTASFRGYYTAQANYIRQESEG